MKKAVVFDFDGTLASTFKIVSKAFECVEENFMHRKFTNEDWERISGPNEEGIINRLIENPLDAKKAFDDYIRDYEKYHDECLKDFIPGIRAILTKLNNLGFFVFLLTGRSKESLDISLKKLEGYQYFKNFYWGSSTGHVKDINLLKILNEYNLKKEDVIYVGDTKDDIDQCRQVDIDIISVVYDDFASHTNFEELNPGMVAHSPSEVYNLIVLN